MKSKGPEVMRSDSEWMAEDDLRTLVRAKEIRKDKQRFAAARALAKKKLAEMRDLAEDKSLV
jgi:hypothetical protein